MTPPEDNHRDEPGGAADGPVDPSAPVDPPLDEDALWRSIVDNYGERVQLPEEPAPADVRAVEPEPEPQVAWSSRDAAAEAPEEEHFVPPEPPPVPRGTPARRLAWAGLFLPPAVMLLAVVLGWVLPDWASTLLVASFVGGFVFLVATMPRDGGDGYDDGAVV